jgi:predicted  nucleic acid-binding Zn ribbon protein
MARTSPKKVTLRKYGKEVAKETEQMRKRIMYFTLFYQVPVDQRQEVVKVCPHCTARLYLE